MQLHIVVSSNWVRVFKGSEFLDRLGFSAEDDFICTFRTFEKLNLQTIYVVVPEKWNQIELIDGFVTLDESNKYANSLCKRNHRPKIIPVRIEDE